jgi:hypothetical protein
MNAVLKPVFVEFIPEVLEDGKIYISETYATAVHKCCCGCGNKVVTPLSPIGWKITIEEEYVSLYPSIGNWNFPCRSHYWIKRNVVHRSYDMSQRKIEAGRRYDAELKEQYFGSGNVRTESEVVAGRALEDRKTKANLWERLKRRLFG